MNCDGIARWYRTGEYVVFGRSLEKTRLHFLSEMMAARNVLILGDGDGRFTAEFVRSNPQARVESLDLSARMIDLAKGRVYGIGGAVTFRVGDARNIALNGPYDLVVSHFFLDCFTDAEVMPLIKRVAQHCEAGARWVVSEFCLPEQGLIRIAGWLLIRFLYLCFRVTTGLKVRRLSDYSLALSRHGFRIAQRHTSLGGLLVSEIWNGTSIPRAEQP